MATPSGSRSSGSYSWWWNSHISPNSSKWLQENLSDIESKVKEMINVIETDADTFTMRAEMFYKRRPELIKLVEDFYRAYRDLAERYSSATRVPTQSPPVPFQLPDEDSPGKFLDSDFNTPKFTIQTHACRDDVQKDDDLEFSPSHFRSLSTNGDYTEKKQLNDMLGSEEKMRKGLDFQKEDEKDQISMESEVMTKLEKDIRVLKGELTKLGGEMEGGFANFQQSLERLSELESEVYRTQEDSKRLDGQAKKAESEVKSLKETFYKLETEKEVNFLKYQLCLSKTKCLALRGKNRALEEEIYLLLEETLISSTQSFIMNNIINEKSAELKEVTYNLDAVNGDIRELMDDEIANGKSLLGKKELELSEVTRKLIATENAKSDLEKVVVDLKKELEELRIITRRGQEMQILKVSENGETDTGKKVLLRDYFYGSSGKRSMAKKKAAKCVCVKPSTRED